MEWKRYRSIVLRWLWLLVLAVFLAVVTSWIYMGQTGRGNTLLIVFLVALGGLVWGLIGIFGVEYLTDNVLVVEDLRRITGKRVLAQVPARRRGPRPLFETPGTTSATAYEMAGMKILPTGSVNHGRTVLVCSPQSTPYTAHVSANLGAVYSQLGHPTLLIDANRVDADLSKALRVEGVPGFAEAISSPSSDVMLHVVPSVPNLYMLPAGAAPLSKQMTFSMPYLRSVIERSGAQGSMIVISGPPVTANGLMALGLAKSANDVVLAVVAAETKRRNLRRAVDTLEQSGAHLAGIVYLEGAPSSFILSLQAALAGSRKRAAEGAVQSTGNRVVDGQVVIERRLSTFTPENVISSGSYSSLHAAPHPGQQVRRVEVTASDITDADHGHGVRNRPAGLVPRPSPSMQKRAVYDPEPALSLGELDTTADGPSFASGLLADNVDLSGLDAFQSPVEAVNTSPSLDSTDISGLDLLGGELAGGAEKKRTSPLSSADSTISINVPGQRPPAADLGSLDSLLDFSAASAPAPAPPSTGAAALESGTKSRPQAPEPTVTPPAPERTPSVEQPFAAAASQAAGPPPSPPVEKRVPEQILPLQPLTASTSPAPRGESQEIPPEIQLLQERPQSTMQALATRNYQVSPPIAAPESAEPPAAPGATLLGVVGGLFAVVSKWLAAQRLAREAERPGNSSRKRRSQPPEGGAGARMKLAGAYVVRTVTARRYNGARTQQARPPLNRQAAPLSQTPVEPGAQRWAPDTPVNTGRLGDAASIHMWLASAEQARRVGDFREARMLVNKVLDRDPRNEAAWKLRLILGDMEQAAGPLRAQEIPVMRTGRRSRVPAWLVALVIIAALGGLIYLEWPQISKIPLPAVFSSSPGGTAVPTQASGVLASATANPADAGYEVKGEFLTFWDAHGGLRILGKPISPRIPEAGENGVTLEVQYFERARLELHPEIKDPASQVTLGRLGVEVPVSGTLANPLPEGLRGDEVRFNETGFDVPQKFYDFWKANDGLSVFGYPLTPVLMDTTPDGKPLAVQYFERARMEYHADKAGTPDEVQLTNLGAQVYAMRHPGR